MARRVVVRVEVAEDTWRMLYDVGKALREPVGVVVDDCVRFTVARVVEHARKGGDLDGDIRSGIEG
jgi:hypothetical protein